MRLVALKIEQLHERGGSKGVVTLIPGENGSENAPMVMWRGVTRPCTQHKRVTPRPERFPPMRSGFPAH